jgi:hypothetical protein
MLPPGCLAFSWRPLTISGTLRDFLSLHRYFLMATQASWPPQSSTIIFLALLTYRHTLTTRYSSHQLGSQYHIRGREECGDSAPTFAQVKKKVCVHARMHTWQVTNYLLARATLTHTRFEPKTDFRRYTSTHNLVAFR